jgi:hypothetical protein
MAAHGSTTLSVPEAPKGNPGYEGFELHVVLDNLNTHKPKRDRWLKRHPNVHLHYTPTSASWPR